MYRVFTILFLMLGHSTLLAKTYTLEDIVRMTVAKNVTVENAAIARMLQRYDVAVAENAFDPKYQLSGQANYLDITEDGQKYSQKTINAQPGVSLRSPIGTEFQFFWENTAFLKNGDDPSSFKSIPAFMITQPLLKNFGKTVNTDSLQSAYEQETLNVLAYRSVLNTAITGSVHAYYDMIAASMNLQIQEAALQRAQKLKDRTMHLIEEGRLPKNEMFEVNSQVNQQSLNISQAKLQLNQARFKLLQQVDFSIDDPEIFDIDHTIHLTQIFPKPKLAQKLAFQFNGAYNQASVAEVQAKRQMEIAKNQNEWQLDLNLKQEFNNGESTDNFGNAINNLGDLDTRSTSVGVSFAMPLGNDLSRKRQVVAARVQTLQSSLNKKAIQNSLENKIATDLESLKILKESLKNQEATAQMRKKSAESASLKYNEGMISAFELTTVQDSLTAAERAVVESKIALAKALADFDATLGTTLTTWHVQFEKMDQRFE